MFNKLLAVGMAMKNIILEKIQWAFYGDLYTTEESFKIALLEFQEDNFEESVIDEICVLSDEIEVSYWTYLDENQIDRKVTVKASNRKSLSAFEILYKLNNLIGSDMSEIDHYFFQGLIENDTSEKPSGRSFTIWQGS
mgnify:CR=1 FL=1